MNYPTVGIKMLSEGQSTSAIAAMELKYPDDEEKKNSVCIPLTVARTPEDYFLATQSASKVESLLGAELGLWWMRSRRCYYLHHFSITQLVHFGWLARPGPRPPGPAVAGPDRFVGPRG